MLDAEQIYKNKLKYMELLTKLNIDLTALYKYLEEKDFFNKPATTQYYRAYPGGLCQYAIDFCYELAQLANAYFPGKYSEQDIIKVALFKDLYRAELYESYMKAVKNDAYIFDFEQFMADYSRTIYPLFLWYAYSASRKTENVLPLIDFKSAVRIGYLDIEQNGANTIAWLGRNVERRVSSLEEQYPDMAVEIPAFAERIAKKGVEPQLTYLFMHGHTLMDNVVLTILTGVCEKLRQMSLSKIICSSKEGVALKNEMSNYTNTLRSIRDVLLDNENYTSSPLYKRLKVDIQRYIDSTISKMEEAKTILI